MKTFIASTAAALVIAAPALAFAQTANHGLTSAQVIQELVDLESVGYSPASGNDANYPENVLAAQQRLQARRVAQAEAAKQAYGPNGQAVSEAGKAAQ
ncbi:DUF4148 domain-containing protein [Burkholderia gladioli]|uniref:DUF4148 domain-containing protein n=1 Tax=Burkholderia gladioli TaxID=28095 RepID=UPI00265469B3|nr:DUF4148 domain-containing protein [Burkholderia gladioli]MDN7601503.1 DUF4148 domain-containing protein [Burkholderia gladioli]